MVRIIFIILILGFNKEMYSGVPPISDFNPLLRFDMGLSMTNSSYGRFYGINGGVRIPARTIVFFAIEGKYLYSNAKYTWPDLGDYSYKKTIGCLSPGLGVSLFHKKRANLNLKLNINFAGYSGKLVTSDPLLQEYLLRQYSGSHTGISLSSDITFHISKHFSCYLDLGYFKITKDIKYLCSSIGLSCKFIDINN